MLSFGQYSEDGDWVEHTAESVIAAGRTTFQSYLFFRSPVHGVCVALDGDIQSCEADEAIYHEALVHPAMLVHPDPRRVLIMGGGEGATAREALRHPGVTRVVMVDMDAEFVELCRTHLAGWNAGAFADPRLDVQCRDINEFLDEPGEGFDVVIGDLVDFNDPDDPAAALYSRQLYERLRRRLNPGAITATQAGGLTTGRTAAHAHVRATLDAAFTNVSSYGIVVPSFYHLWSYVLASDERLPDVDALPMERFAQRATARRLALPATGPASLAATFALPVSIYEKLQKPAT
ncbi:methyltransferase domain-containing protein [Arhodomonas aquaeolei]|uniref:spermine/spermidine synthase domain-containing protein n=1 Tax=Arhodomonas aquaeolei TaxID=2369 RepID=UPI002167A861|nr:methyltransferase domain-containing protein [Arhodomonas aquaeolei]MCS4503300.1 methyltransferase domain-containing protein [Arhodomonas aquaeolei]